MNYAKEYGIYDENLDILLKEKETNNSKELTNEEKDIRDSMAKIHKPMITALKKSEKIEDYLELMR